MLRLIIIVAALNVALTPFAVAMAGSNEEDKEPAELANYTRTGEVENCLRLRDISSTRILDNQHILFTVRNGDVYLNKLPHRCGGMKRNDTIVYEVSGGSVCSVDVFTVAQLGSTCGFGTFQELEPKEE